MDTRLPRHHEPYTDQYFLNAKRILEKEDINPQVKVKVFTRMNLPVNQRLLDGIQSIAEKVFAGRDVDLWLMDDHGGYQAEDPIIVYEGPAQEVVDLETVLLGKLSSVLTSFASTVHHPRTTTFRRKVREAVASYEVPLVYFGARHYDPFRDEELAGAALRAGAVQTSTFVGSAPHLYKAGVGTTPHFLTIVLASQVDWDLATYKTATLFDKHIDGHVPRTILVDTFNLEIEDTLTVLDYLTANDATDPGIRIDTCGENIAQGGRHREEGDREYEAGPGVTVASVKAIRDAMREEGYGDCRVILSSGMGNPEKARIFAQANEHYRKEHDMNLFHGIGAGDFHTTAQCTADIYQVADEPLAKTGRELKEDPVDNIERIA